MTKKPLDINASDEKFLKLLEKNVELVLKDRTAKPGERMQAIQAGAKLLAIRHKIGGGDEGNFFDK